MKRALVAGAALLVACSSNPPKSPASPKTREGTTVVTSCPSAAPKLAAEDLEPAAPLSLAIERVCTYGASDANRAEVERALTFRIGAPLATEEVRASIEALVATRLFDDVAIGAEKRGNGALVHVVLTERPRVEEVVYDGASAAQMTSPVEYDKPIDRFVLAAAADKIESEYHLHGYGAAKVTFVTEPTKPGFVRVRFKVVEGTPWKLAKISFPGTTKLSEAELRALSGLTPGSAWNPTALAQAAQRIVNAYYDRGYVNVRMEELQRDVAADGAVTVTWPVQEGERFSVGKVSFSGAPADKLEGELRAAMKTRTKAVFDRSMLQADIARIRELFAKRGKKVEVNPLTKTDQKAKTIEIEIELREIEGGS
ncbi:MAG: hypothetical protein KIT84_09910 [Labilithrix sp.]|nr:hypothetical protein [Labilithrix sp.]MCW5811317.1 hypothetical protein [Labilithrix sp.]